MIKLSNKDAIALCERINKTMREDDPADVLDAMEAMDPIFEQFCERVERKGMKSDRDAWMDHKIELHREALTKEATCETRETVTISGAEYHRLVDATARLEAIIDYIRTRKSEEVDVDVVAVIAGRLGDTK